MLFRSGLLRGGGFTQLIIQAKGIGAVALLVFPTSLAAWWVIKLFFGVRVPAADEVVGLDLAEIGMEAYPDAVEIEDRVRQAAGPEYTRPGGAPLPVG